MVVGRSIHYDARTRVQQPKRSNNDTGITRVPAHIMHRHFMSRRSTSLSVNGSIHGRTSVGRNRKFNSAQPVRKRARRRPHIPENSVIETLEQESEI
ncbi:hypothetical protein AC249_AIPGENE19901 [Exaiptasia diaphana]|nr:hypothetical protein AC249_AIPGENE19901 [Exaiptasia diaphana]